MLKLHIKINKVECEITVSTILTFRSYSNYFIGKLYFGAVRRSLGTLHMPQCIYYEQTSSLITKEIGNPKIFENGNFSTKFVLDGSLQPKGLENHFEMYLNMLVYITRMWLWKKYMNNCYFQNNLPG